MNIEMSRQAVNATREALGDFDLCFLNGKSADPWQAEIEVRKVIFDRHDTPQAGIAI